MQDKSGLPHGLAALRWLAGALVAAAALVLFLQAPFGLQDAGPAAPGGKPGSAPRLDQLPAKAVPLLDQPVTTIAADEARRRNAAVPFAATPLVAARPFKFGGNTLDRTRAVDCLAVAAMAEAGRSDAGQRAVIQVILNRVRHPAFPNTVCGAVFAGSQRKTGCQFTFTCDGAMARTYSTAAWTEARKRAAEALDGRVYAPIGLATHYHTDWVYPYWSPELEKLARVETHLFFRWPGYWGSRAAMAARYRGNEPTIAALAGLPSHAQDDAIPDALAADSGAAANSTGEVVVSHASGRAFFVHLGSQASADGVLSLGRELCPSDRTNCQVMAWLERDAIPASYPLPPSSRAKLTFSYVREADGEIVFYDCARYPETPREKCIPRARPV